MIIKFLLNKTIETKIFSKIHLPVAVGVILQQEMNVSAKLTKKLMVESSEFEKKYIYSLSSIVCRH